MPKMQHGASLPVRNLPSPVIHTADEELPVPERYLEWIVTKVHRHLEQLANEAIARARVVEEYTNGSFQSATQETILTLVPDYSPASERITSILVAGPTTTAFTLQLGDRYLVMNTGTQGFVAIHGLCITLKPTSQRILTSATPGDWYLQLSGYALGAE
jgi:hypothetical protein